MRDFGAKEVFAATLGNDKCGAEVSAGRGDLTGVSIRGSLLTGSAFAFVSNFPVVVDRTEE